MTTERCATCGKELSAGPPGDAAPKCASCGAPRGEPRSLATDGDPLSAGLGTLGGHADQPTLGTTGPPPDPVPTPSNATDQPPALQTGAQPPESAQEKFDFLAPPQAEGEIGRLAGYRILQVLGAGGMGVVFLAEDITLGRLVAMKVIKPGLASSESARRRFLRETRATAAIEHENIVSIYQVGEDRGVLFLTMPYLRGESLGTRLKRERKLPLADVLRIGRETARGLAAAHARDMVHRDIKPGNIWLEAVVSGQESGVRGQESGGQGGKGKTAPAQVIAPSTVRVKILDFGLARSTTEDTELTHPGAVLGTPAFMAPEQAAGEKVDQRSDLFSLGCVLYRMCTGELPFQGANIMATLRALAVVNPRPPRAVTPDVPPSLSNLVMRLLSRDPEQRPASAQAVIGELDAIERDPATWAPVKTDAPTPPPAPPPPKPASLPPRKPRSRAAVVVQLLLVAAAVTAFIVTFRQTNTGRLVISGEERFKVVVKRGGRPYLGPTEDRELRLPAGEYRIELADAEPGLTVSPREVQVKWGSITPVKVVFDPESFASPVDALRARRISSYELAASGGGDPEKAPPALVAVLGESWLNHQRSAVAVICTPDGQTTASAGADGVVRLWDLASGRERRVFAGHDGPATSLAVSQDGRWILSGGVDGVAILWDVATGKALTTLRGHRAPIRSVALSPDGKWAATASETPEKNGDNTVRIWDAATGKEVRKHGHHVMGATAVAFSPDGATVASAGEEGNAELTAVEGTQAKGWLQLKGTPINAIAFSPDGKVIAVAADRAVKLWNTDGDQAQTLTEHEGTVAAVAFGPDGTVVASAGHDRVVRVTDIATREQAVLRAHPDAVLGVAWTPDGRTLVSSSADHSLRFWEVTVRRRTFPRKTEIAARDRLGPLTLATESVAFSPDGRTVAAGGREGNIREWDVLTLKERVRRASHEGAVGSLAYSPDGSVLVSGGTADERVKVWETASGTQRGELKQGAGVGALAISPDGKWLAAGNVEGKVKLWDLAAGTEAHTFDMGSSAVASLAFSRDGKLLAASDRGESVRAWDVAARTSIPRARGFEDHGFSVAFTPSGKQLALRNSDLFLTLNDFSTGKEATRLPGPGDARWRGWQRSARSRIVVSGDGNRMAAWNYDGTINVWSLDNPSNPQRIKVGLPGMLIQDLAFSPEGRHLATANGNGTVYVLRLAPPVMKER